jgi:hypothetical protein
VLSVCLSVSSLSSFEPNFRKFGMNFIPLAATPMSCALISYTDKSSANACTGNAEVTLILPHNLGPFSDV